MTAIELRLGPRPDEPGPPIGQGPQSYSADVRERLATLGAEPVVMTPADFSAWLKAEIPAMAKIVKDEKITVE